MRAEQVEGRHRSRVRGHAGCWDIDGEHRCEPGRDTVCPRCTWHEEHHWCDTCQGFYGVPHDGSHDGLNPHPHSLHEAKDCACRPCRNYVEACAAKGKKR